MLNVKNQISTLQMKLSGQFKTGAKQQTAHSLSSLRQPAYDSVSFKGDDKTPLDVAREQGPKEIIELLEAHGAKTGKELQEEGTTLPKLEIPTLGLDPNGQTPLDVAKAQDSQEMIDLLEAHGAKTGQELNEKG